MSPAADLVDVPCDACSVPVSLPADGEARCQRCGYWNMGPDWVRPKGHRLSRVRRCGLCRRRLGDERSEPSDAIVYCAPCARGFTPEVRAHLAVQPAELAVTTP